MSYRREKNQDQWSGKLKIAIIEMVVSFNIIFKMGCLFFLIKFKKVKFINFRLKVAQIFI